MRPLINSDVVATHTTVSHFLGLDMLSLSINQKDAFCAALVVLASASKVPQSQDFILDALAQTFSIFLQLDRALNSNMEISSKLDALKTQKIEFEQAQLAKKQATKQLSELGIEYDAHIECIRAFVEELEKEKEKLTFW